MSGLDVVWISKSYPKENTNVAEIFSSSTFYPKENLEENIAKSKQLAAQFYKKEPLETDSEKSSQFRKRDSSIEWKNISISVAIVVGIILLVAFIRWFFKKDRIGRYGNNRF